MSITSKETELTTDRTPLSSSQLQFDRSASQGLLSDQPKEEVPEERPKIPNELEIMIFLRDRTTLKINLEDGHRAKVPDFIAIVFEAQKLPEDAKDIFCLWLISPLLEVRLKPSHQPYLLSQQWEDFCDLYTDASNEDLVLDEPMMYFQRNVFYPLHQESQVTDTNALLYLYHEAKYNVVIGRYMMSMADYDRLSGIQALIHLQHYDPHTHVPALYRSHLDQFYPTHLCKTKGWFGMKKSPMHDSLAGKLEDHHRAISDHHRKQNIESLLPKLYRQYLEICWKYPFYGAAFFPGSIEQPSKKLFYNTTQQVDVFVAVNTEGVCIIDRLNNEMLLNVTYTHLSWDMSESEDSDTPILLLQFSHEHHTKLLTVYSRQARLMNALIESCVNLKKREMNSNEQGVVEYISNAGDTVDGPVGKIKCEFKRIDGQFEKLCLCSYSNAGEKLS